MDSPNESVQVYTTRPDTIFGMTFVALVLLQNPLVPLITDAGYQEAVTTYQASTSSRSNRRKPYHDWCLYRSLRNTSSDWRTYPNLDRRFCVG